MQIFFDITGRILDFYQHLSQNLRNGENSGLVFAPGISDSIEYAIFLEG